MDKCELLLVMNWLKKIIPAYIEFRSLYWVQYGAKIELALEIIFNNIDNDNLEEASKLITEFESQFTQSGVPDWIAVKYAEIYRAKSMSLSLI